MPPVKRIEHLAPFFSAFDGNECHSHLRRPGVEPGVPCPELSHHLGCSRWAVKPAGVVKVLGQELPLLGKAGPVRLPTGGDVPDLSEEPRIAQRASCSRHGLGARPVKRRQRGGRGQHVPRDEDRPVRKTPLDLNEELPVGRGGVFDLDAASVNGDGGGPGLESTLGNPPERPIVALPSEALAQLQRDRPIRRSQDGPGYRQSQVGLTHQPTSPPSLKRLADRAGKVQVYDVKAELGQKCRRLGDRVRLVADELAGHRVVVVAQRRQALAEFPAGQERLIQHHLRRAHRRAVPPADQPVGQVRIAGHPGEDHGRVDPHRPDGKCL